jgi:hypothetical protein
VGSTRYFAVSTEQDQARLIAERVARRVAGSRVSGPSPDRSGQVNAAPVSEELSAIREGLHDLESKLERIESSIVHHTDQPGGPTRARLIDFVSTDPPASGRSSITQTPSISQAPQTSAGANVEPSPFIPVTRSPWVRDFNLAADHPSQERFGIEEATVAELVEFFENEKKCSVEPGGKPCDHCSMCSSRGF